MSDRGYVVSTGDNYVVREKLLSSGKVVVYVHGRINGREQMPRGYTHGCNYLEFTPPAACAHNFERTGYGGLSNTEYQCTHCGETEERDRS